MLRFAQHGTRTHSSDSRRAARIACPSLPPARADARVSHRAAECVDIAPSDLEGTPYEGQSRTALLLRATADIRAGGCVCVSYGDGGYMDRSWRPAPTTRCATAASADDLANFLEAWRLDLAEIGHMCARRVAGDEEEDKRARSELKELSRQRAQRVPVARPPTAVVEEVEAEVEAGGGVPVRRVVA